MTSTRALLQLAVAVAVVYRAVLVTLGLGLPELLFAVSVAAAVLSLARRRFEWVSDVLSVQTPPTPVVTLVAAGGRGVALAWGAGRAGAPAGAASFLLDVAAHGPGDEPLRWATQVPHAPGESVVELGELPPAATYRIRVWAVGARDGLKIASAPVIVALPPADAPEPRRIEERKPPPPPADAKPDLAMILHATSFAKQRQSAEQEVQLLASSLQEEEAALQAELRGLREVRRQEDSTRKSLLRGLREMEDSRKNAEMELQRKQKECADAAELVNAAAATADEWSAELQSIQEGTSLTVENVTQMASQRRTQLVDTLSAKAREGNELRDVVNGLREQVLAIEAEIKLAWNTIANLAVASPPEPFGVSAEWQEELLALQAEATRRQNEAVALEALLVEESRQKMALLRDLAAATR